METKRASRFGALFCAYALASSLSGADGAETYCFVLKWGTQGSADAQFSSPLGIAVDSSGNVFVADTNNHRIQKFDSWGNLVAKWGSEGSGDGQFNLPTGIALDSSANVFVTEYVNHRIQKFDSSGNFLGKWGLNGSGDGEFNQPRGIAVDSYGNVFVADSGNHRIQKFRREPEIRIIGPPCSPTIAWRSETGRSYKIWLSGDLLDWITAGGIQPAPGTGFNVWWDDGLHGLGPPSGAPRRFYRIEQLP